MRSLWGLAAPGPGATLGPMQEERNLLLADAVLTGSAWCRAYAGLIDQWLAQLFAEAMASEGVDPEGLCLVAVGGYGRRELAPGSDIDVMLLHDGRRNPRPVAERLWYPIWERGLRLGHSVCTTREALRLAYDDLSTATTLLSTRHVAGDPELSGHLASAALIAWEGRSRHWLSELAASVTERHARVGEVAFLLEPDLKEGRGGLRDVQALGWAEAAHRVLLDVDGQALEACSGVLLAARVELQRRTGGTTNVLALQEQPGVAAALGDADATALMARVAEAARSIAWTSDDAWRRIGGTLVGRLSRRLGRTQVLGPGLAMTGGEVLVTSGAPGNDPILPLRVAHAAARNGAAIERASLEWLAAQPGNLPVPWPDEARQLFLSLLGTGPAAIGVIEALDQRGLWGRLLPEWGAIRSLPPQSAYHRYTVDRHLLEAVANAARLVDRVTRPELLLMAALLHDLGKGCRGDHAAAGSTLAREIATRMGFPPADADTIALAVELHLLLPQVATTRDLDDPATARRVAGAVGTPERLGLLAALTEADSLATGASAWGGWKAELVGLLVERTEAVFDALAGEAVAPATPAADPFPSARQLERLALPGRHIEGRGKILTVMTDDRPGLFSRVAGVLALHGLDVLAAAAYSSESGRALNEFRVSDPRHDEPPWKRVIADLERALDGGLALHARVGERAKTYARQQVRSRASAAPAVRFDNEASERATVIDVRAPDAIGTLYRITRTLADFDLDIRNARVQTLGSEVVDAFYVRDRQGRKVVEPARLAEIERAILHVLAE